MKEKNNHGPLFNQSSYWVSVPSSVGTGSKLVKVSATDKDLGENGEVVYNIVADSSTSNRLENKSEYLEKIWYQINLFSCLIYLRVKDCCKCFV